MNAPTERIEKRLKRSTFIIADSVEELAKAQALTVMILALNTSEKPEYFVKIMKSKKVSKDFLHSIVPKHGVYFTLVYLTPISVEQTEVISRGFPYGARLVVVSPDPAKDCSLVHFSQETMFSDTRGMYGKIISGKRVTILGLGDPNNTEFSPVKYWSRAQMLKSRLFDLDTATDLIVSPTEAELRSRLSKGLSDVAIFISAHYCKMAVELAQKFPDKTIVVDTVGSIPSGFPYFTFDAMIAPKTIEWLIGSAR